MEQILMWAERLTGDPVTALTWAFRARIPGYGKRAVQLARDGRAEDRIRFLASEGESWGAPVKRNPVLDFPDLFEPPWHEAAAGLTWSFEVGEGWRDVIEGTLERLQAMAQQDQVPIRVTRISVWKGALLMDTDREDGGIWTVTLGARLVSMNIGEICGKPGRREDHPHV